MWNTFDAYRQLHWAGLHSPDAQRALNHALLKAYNGEGRNPGVIDGLLDLVAPCGLDVDAARKVIEQGRHADEVREAESFWQQAGIRSVPPIVIDRQHLIPGGLPPVVFEQAIRQIAAAHP